MARKTLKKSNSSSMFIVLLLVIFALVGYVYTSPKFEQVKPTVKMENSTNWNRLDKLVLTIEDDTSLKSYKVELSDGKNSVTVDQEIFNTNVTSKTVEIQYPKKSELNLKSKTLTLNIDVQDKSLWNMMQGNSINKQIDLNVDYRKPSISILSHSYSISQGGSALVIFQAKDDNLDEVSIEANGNTFKVQPYLVDGYYVALVAWPFNDSSFSAKIVATDSANNVRKSSIPFYLINKAYKVSNIKASEKFINGKISDLASTDPEYAHIEDPIEKFQSINETMRLKNEELIHSLSKGVSTDTLESWKIKPFYPLRNGQKVASYGDTRHYYYKHKHNEVSSSYHVGLDLASTKMAIVKSSNAGKVVFSGENGIYGNMPMIDHGLGLYTLYGHSSDLLVEEGDEVHAGQSIAKTGKSGLALGDHLHFGILVQGIEVRPAEWFDKEWIRKNIDNIFKQAKDIINSK